ncbi:MAG: ABC transporter, ATP-binding protein (cluster 1, maltose/g3p/polyamine/iron); ABC transporter, ATP-binding protein (cluster 10, nitrate/sulfonate/bicarbonate), partial [uncultured Acetobacteraceae bacterium]
GVPRRVQDLGGRHRPRARSAARRGPRRGAGRVRGATRAVRLRQIDAALPDRRVGGGDGRRHPILPRRGGPALARPQPDLPGDLALPLALRLAERSLRPVHPRRAGGGAPQRGARSPGPRRPGRGDAQAPGRALGRDAPARGGGPRAGHAPQGPADGRALRRARRADARQDAGLPAGRLARQRRLGAVRHPPHRRGRGAGRPRGGLHRPPRPHQEHRPGRPAAAARPLLARMRPPPRPPDRRTAGRGGPRLRRAGSARRRRM